MTTDGVQMIADERLRQLKVEGWDADHDRGQYDRLALAAVCYAVPSVNRPSSFMDAFWPWDSEWWKPTPADRIRELVKAGALIAAAIDSMLEAGYQTMPPGYAALTLEGYGLGIATQDGELIEVSIVHTDAEPGTMDKHGVWAFEPRPKDADKS